MDAPVCLIDTLPDGKLEVQPKALQILSQFEEPVVTVAVVGLYRTGKSYLMNRLAGRDSGFALGNTIESKTKGIWMWCLKHPKKAGTNLVLLDTEGLGDVDKGDSKHDTRIFSLAVLLSSTLVLNTRGTIDNKAIEELQYVTELTEYIKVKSDEAVDDSEYVKFFPGFVWAVRDFTLRLNIDGQEKTDDEYLEFALKLKPGTSAQVNNYNLPRACIRKYFPSRKCFTFPFPTNPDNVSELETLDPSEISSKFHEAADRFCEFIFEEILGHLAKTYVDTISSGAVPCLENAVIAMAQIENEAAVKEALVVYQTGMEKLRCSFPVELKEMTMDHQCYSLMATQTFMNRSFRDVDGAYLKCLQEHLSSRFDEYQLENERASEGKCEILLSILSEYLTEKIDDGFYTRAGGYSLFTRDLKDVVEQYNTQSANEVKAAAVLEKFLQQKVSTSTAILQADDKLTANERKICEEQERAVLLEQEILAQEQQQKQLEQRMEAQQQDHEVSMRQAINQMEAEMRFQQREAQRALDSKLREQEALLNQGFQERADKMRMEVSELQRKNREVEDRKSREFNQMMADMQNRNQQNMAALQEQHRQQMQAINNQPRPQRGGCCVQ
ncbi:hypothetical protein DNTS_013449 [Danionella cerebrum]|uniref:GB1/RHD3-type G domain-containing protein n=1 Tax=Danionella cerebrum TaxID=2873325 RepID=A0A553MQ31_9TELE|nr:hypothetical protein DNTS_013449 [Danionella translucida]TRY55287.1 hypothetical protein DNTS_013449 [Danionella translucida]